MEVCRACLLTENNMMPLNITFVENYNLLTNLDVTLCDGMPQFVCQNCYELLKCFLEFRAKCISSETTLREVIENIKPDDLDLQLESKTSNIKDDDLFKQEIKIELPNEPHTFDYFSDHYDDNDNANINIKPDLTDVYARKSKRTTKTKQYALKNRLTKIKIKKEKITEGKSFKDAKPKKYKNQKIKDIDILDKFLSCGLCQIKFEEKNALKSHLETHLNSRRCEICYEQFKTWQQLFGHRIQHLSRQERRCHICDKRHMACANLEFHYLTVHGDGQEVSISCKYCEKSYSNPLKLNKHIASVHSQREKKFICDYCSKSFVLKSLMRKHIQASHTDIRPYACDLCGYSCKTKSNLVAHAAKHSPDKVNCKKCSKFFMNKQKFDEHTCQVKSFICPICGKLMPDGRQVMFKRHMATHDPEGRFACDRCPRRFRGRGGLQAHLNRHDGNRTEKCELCVAEFYTRSSLIRHRRIHTGEKPYGCNICSKKFMSNFNLKTHMKVHGIFIINHRNKDPEDAG